MGLCRACMATIQINLHSLSKNSEIFLLFNQFTALNVDLNDGLPNVLCESCVDKLFDFRTFRTKCLNSYTVLKSNLEINRERQDIVLNEFLDTKETYGTFIDFVKDDIKKMTNVVSDGVATSSEKISKVELESDGDEENAKEAADNNSSRDSEEESEMDSDEIASRKYIQEQEKLKKKKKNYITFPFKCARCDRGFRYEERLLGHMREHEGHRAAVCEFCNREYAEWSGLQKHVNLFHKDEIKYICNFCGKKFIYESALETHKLTHSGPSKHICETCGKSFSSWYQLNRHKLAHTDETPFECDACGKKFKTNQRLKTHQYRHTGIKKFVCTTCGKGFTTSPELRHHLVVHSDKKEFKCTLCQQMFRQRSQLSAHKQSHMF